MTRLLHSLAIVAAGVWLGGMIMIALVAANTFHTMNMIEVAHPSAAAGRIMAGNFGHFDTLQLACAGILVVGCGVGVLASRRKFGPLTRLILSLIATGAMLYSVQFLTPKLESLQHTVATADAESQAKKTFDEFHDSAVMISKINLALIGIVALSLGWSGPPKPFDPNEEVVMPPTPASMP